MSATDNGTRTLFFSFWDVSLSNFPFGTFAHRRLLPVEAKQLIDRTRMQGKVIGVSGDDLFAPYFKHKLDSHQELREVLKNTYGISPT